MLTYKQWMDKLSPSKRHVPQNVCEKATSCNMAAKWFITSTCITISTIWQSQVCIVPPHTNRRPLASTGSMISILVIEFSFLTVWFLYSCNWIFMRIVFRCFSISSKFSFSFFPSWVTSLSSLLCILIILEQKLFGKISLKHFQLYKTKVVANGNIEMYSYLLRA